MTEEEMNLVMFDRLNEYRIAEGKQALRYDKAVFKPHRPNPSYKVEGLDFNTKNSCVYFDYDDPHHKHALLGWFRFYFDSPNITENLGPCVRGSNSEAPYFGM